MSKNLRLSVGIAIVLFMSSLIVYTMVVFVGFTRFFIDVFLIVVALSTISICMVLVQYFKDTSLIQKSLNKKQVSVVWVGITLLILLIFLRVAGFSSPDLVRSTRILILVCVIIPFSSGIGLLFYIFMGERSSRKVLMRELVIFFGYVVVAVALILFSGVLCCDSSFFVYRISTGGRHYTINSYLEVPAPSKEDPEALRAILFHTTKKIPRDLLTRLGILDVMPFDTARFGGVRFMPENFRLKNIPDDLSIEYKGERYTFKTHVDNLFQAFRVPFIIFAYPTYLFFHLIRWVSRKFGGKKSF